MNKAELVVAVSESTKFTKKEVETIVDEFLKQVSSGLESGEVVKVSGFGVFQVKSRKERTGTSPVDGKKIKIPASKTVGFKPSKTLKDLVK